MTDQRLQAIKARAAAATRGPWVASDARKSIRGGYYERKGLSAVLAVDETYIAHYVKTPDAEFIAASRQDVEWLLGEVERLGKVLTIKNDALLELTSECNTYEEVVDMQEAVRMQLIIKENRALQARLDAVVAVVDKWEATQAHNRDQLRAGGLLKTTPTPEAFRAALKGDPDGR